MYHELLSFPIIRSFSTKMPRTEGIAPACLGRGRGRSIPETRKQVAWDSDVLLPTATAVRGYGVRRFGVLDAVQNRIINRNVNQQGAGRCKH